jgi:hypothetical protein
VSEHRRGVPVPERSFVTILDLSLAILVVAALTVAGALLVSGPTEDREELGRQLRSRRWR